MTVRQACELIILVKKFSNRAKYFSKTGTLPPGKLEGGLGASSRGRVQAAGTVETVHGGTGLLNRLRDIAARCPYHARELFGRHAGCLRYFNSAKFANVQGGF